MTGIYSMRIDVVGKHIEITPAIQTYAESKTERLLKVFDGTQQIRVYLESPQGKKAEFHVEIAVDVVKRKDFIANAVGPDLYAAIDLCVDKAMRQLRDWKEQIRQ